MQRSRADFTHMLLLVAVHVVRIVLPIAVVDTGVPEHLPLE